MHPAFPALLAGVTAVLIGPRLYRRVLLPQWRIRYWRRALRRHAGIVAGRCLGIGREGVVYEVLRSPHDHLEIPLAAKINFGKRGPKAVRETDRVLAVFDRIERAGLADHPMMIRLAEAGVLDTGREPVPFQVFERLRARTLRDEIRAGGLRELGATGIMQRISGLLSLLEQLERAGVHNTHLSLRNVMLEESTGALRLIDLEAFTAKELDSGGVLRMHRRLARVMDHMLAEVWPGLVCGPEEKEVARLDGWMAHHRLPREKAPPLSRDHFDSLHQIHHALLLAMGCAERDAPGGSVALGSEEQRAKA